MLKSPMKFSARLSGLDIDVLNGSTVVSGTPAVDACWQRTFAPTDCNATSNEITLADHGIEDGEPISFLGSDLPANIQADRTYWAEYVDKDTIKIYIDAPGGNPRGFADQGTGTHTIRVHRRAKFVLLVNFGLSQCVVMGCQDAADTISDPDEWPVIHKDACQPFLLDVSGYKCLAFYGLGGTTDVRISPLENF